MNVGKGKKKEGKKPKPKKEPKEEPNPNPTPNPNPNPNPNPKQVIIAFFLFGIEEVGPYLPYISTTSPLYLLPISLPIFRFGIEAVGLLRVRGSGDSPPNPTPTPHPHPTPNHNPNPTPEQVGIQIEEPFSILPLEAFCNSAIAACNQEMLGAVSSGVFAQPTRDEEENVYGNVVPVRARAFENNGAVQ